MSSTNQTNQTERVTLKAQSDFISELLELVKQTQKELRKVEEELLQSKLRVATWKHVASVAASNDTGRVNRIYNTATNALGMTK